MNNYNWYSTIIRPSWSPPPFLFAPVWSFLYSLIAISFFNVFYKAINKQIPLIVALPFILNLIFNFSFSYFQFELKNNLLAAIDIFLILLTLIWALFSIWQYSKWIVYINIPYLLWVMFATALQFTITYLNR